MGHRILESILVVRKGVISCYTVKHVRVYLEKLILYKGSYSASCKEALFRTSSFIFRTSILIQNVSVSLVLERTR